MPLPNFHCPSSDQSGEKTGHGGFGGSEDQMQLDIALCLLLVVSIKHKAAPHETIHVGTVECRGAMAA